MDTVTTDHRYRMLVLLQRTDRPSLIKFYCPFCRNFVAELLNSEVSVMSDLIDFESTSNYGPGIRCNGKLEPGAPHCRTWFYLTLGEK